MMLKVRSKRTGEISYVDRDALKVMKEAKCKLVAQYKICKSSAIISELEIIR